jgi:hypothetical protein
MCSFVFDSKLTFIAVPLPVQATDVGASMMASQDWWCFDTHHIGVSDVQVPWQLYESRLVLLLLLLHFTDTDGRRAAPTAWRGNAGRSYRCTFCFVLFCFVLSDTIVLPEVFLSGKLAVGRCGMLCCLRSATTMGGPHHCVSQSSR